MTLQFMTLKRRRATLCRQAVVGPVAKETNMGSIPCHPRVSV
jgi:hypothetical protein